MNNKWALPTHNTQVYFFDKKVYHDLNAHYVFTHVWMVIGLSVNLKKSLCKCVAQT